MRLSKNRKESLKNYGYAESQEGKPVKDEPLKVYDHAMDGLRYALMSLQAQSISWRVH